MIANKALITGRVTAKVYTFTRRALELLAKIRFVDERAGRSPEETKARYLRFLADQWLGGGLAIKRWAPTFWQRARGLPGSPMIMVNHNIVTNEGDALIADQLAETPARNKVDNTNGHIAVGTGFATELKTTLALVTPTGSPEIMDATFPKLKGAFSAADDNVTQYRATFEAGDLTATGIDEAVLINNTTEAGADNMAYAEITPTVDVTASDTLQVDWELTLLGA